ncbi:MAG: hypothetical protein P9M14_10690, partial [Candidatus Alcyoniella australis]|nr:hypothetical protein [Candidatus Alcyoniella australis]
MNKRKTFEQSHLAFFEPTEKVGLLGTIDPQGLPHVSLITSMQAKSPTMLIWGEFTKGLSKEYVRQNRKTGFLIMTLDRKLWRGKADYDHAATEGADYEMFNNKPMFRYNSYLG